MKLLFIGDVFGGPGREKIKTHLPGVIEKEGIFFTIAQGENLAGGIGITENTAKEMFKVGVDCITTGNHVWKHKEILEYIERETRLLRPANFPKGAHGRGYFVYEKSGAKIGVINLQGRVFMKPLDDPFKVGRKVAEEIRIETSVIFVDMHAEATSEKRALALYLAECVTGIVGTHTHVQTADEQIINGKTAYITDVGMVGSVNSIIGNRKDEIIEHFLLSVPRRFVAAKDNIKANCVIIDFNEKTGAANVITRYNF
ncbi:metallophosphoesterase [candidate division WOR_3 bacterium SM23_42]|uniref:Metallophosphoesterase n=1 Tax=candidate division WOR_3 bacterium SM23_42 TaxID=1703779 RepID=A0A0S8FRC9_UNCW3|nr:MAG: metallophosphoesterase [candidate division WOR_3 bacterium SM23_42]